MGCYNKKINLAIFSSIAAFSVFDICWRRCNKSFLIIRYLSATWKNRTTLEQPLRIKSCQRKWKNTKNIQVECNLSGTEEKSRSVIESVIGSFRFASSPKVFVLLWMLGCVITLEMCIKVLCLFRFLLFFPCCVFCDIFSDIRF